MQESSKAVGEQAFGHRYLHVSALSSLPREELDRVGLTMRHAGLVAGQDFHVVKLHRDGREVSLLIARPAALVPKPRGSLTRYHGVFAPNSHARAQVTLAIVAAP